MTPAEIRQRRLLRLCFAAGIAVIALIALLGSYQRVPGCNIPSVQPFQLAGSELAYRSILASAGPNCEDDAVRAFHSINRVDLFAYIPAYTAFLCLFFGAMLQSHRALLARIAIAATLAGAGFDAVETWLQLGITAGERSGDAVFESVTIAAIAKYGFLAVASALAGAILLGDRRARLRVMGGVALVSGVAACVGVAFEDGPVVMTIGIALAWLIMLLHAAIGGFGWRRLST